MSTIFTMACAMCALGQPSKLSTLMPLMLGFPYLVALVVFRVLRHLSQEESP